jgi:tetratricopeptide (TPR) repeat protein
LAIRLDDIRYRKWRWVPTGGGKGGARPEASAGQYREAFRAAGLDLAALDPREAAKRVSASGVKAELVAALDDWALWEADAALRDRLLAVAAQADPGGWTDRLRDPAVRGDKAAVAKLASSADLEKAVPATLCVLAELMRRHGLSADALLTAARAKHPTDFELSFTQAQGRLRLRKDGSALGAYESARSLRPDNVTVWNNLGGLLHALGDAPGAAAAYREAVRLDPTFPLTHHGLGNALRDSGDDAGAAAAYAEAVRLDDKLAFAHKALAELHLKANRVAAATASARAAVAADGEHAGGHAVLAECLERSGDAAGAAAARREAERLAK